MNTKQNITGLLVTIATAVIGIWVGPMVLPDTPLATKIAQSVVVALALAVSPSRMRQVRHSFMAFAGIAIAVALFIPSAFHLDPKSAAAGLVAVLPAVITNINGAFGQQEKTETAGAIPQNSQAPEPVTVPMTPKK